MNDDRLSQQINAAAREMESWPLELREATRLEGTERTVTAALKREEERQRRQGEMVCQGEAAAAAR
ncbi:MAG: hypothetical protein J0H09_29790 [Burkholderiales bacterium]|nr:hypothetical protein [Burkholderiales bacterium]